MALIDITFCIPTLNSGTLLESCLKSIKAQTTNLLTQIIIADGGSIDNTLDIARNYNCKIIKNPLKTAEAGKALALKKATGKYLIFIDSDNILPDKKWLTTMLFPFSDPDIVGSEPIEFTYRLNGGYIERYCSLIGANDPYAFFMGNYDRLNRLDNTWTKIKIKTIDKAQYLKIKIENNSNLPTIGANGTVFRRKFLQNIFSGDYLFDIDALAIAPKPLYFAKVKTGIIHTYCESSFNKFIRKQTRRVKDRFTYQHIRNYQWKSPLVGSSVNKFYILVKDNFSFGLYSLLILPSFIDSVRGYLKIPDPAWFFHPLACLSTFFIYTLHTLLHLLGFNTIQKRQLWSQ